MPLAMQALAPSARVVAGRRVAAPRRAAAPQVPTPGPAPPVAGPDSRSRPLPGGLFLDAFTVGECGGGGGGGGGRGDRALESRGVGLAPGRVELFPSATSCPCLWLACLHFFSRSRDRRGGRS